MAEVATVGGYQKQYQVTVDPNRLRGYGIGIQQVVDAVRDGTAEVGGRLMEFGGTEYMVRGRGYAESIEDFEEIVVGRSELGSPIRIKDLGEVMAAAAGAQDLQVAVHRPQADVREPLPDDPVELVRRRLGLQPAQRVELVEQPACRLGRPVPFELAVVRKFELELGPDQRLDLLDKRRCAVVFGQREAFGHCATQ